MRIHHGIMTFSFAAATAIAATPALAVEDHSLRLGPERDSITAAPAPGEHQIASVGQADSDGTQTSEGFLSAMLPDGINIEPPREAYRGYESLR